MISISIVTPSLNQARFLEQALRSVLDSGYQALEHIVVDGGSTDGSLEIIERYAPRLAWWTSAPDGGQYDALQKGFARTAGEVMAYLNSDDLYMPWALHRVGQIFARFPEIEWLTSLRPLAFGEDGLPVACTPTPGFDRASFLRGATLGDRAWIQQESTFWRRSLWKRAGGYIDDSLELAGDLELWARFFEHADLYGVEIPLGGLRIHAGQRSAQQMDGYLREAWQVVERHGGGAPSRAAGLSRRALNALVGGGDLGRVPGAAALARAGLLRPTRTVRWRDGDWHIAQTYAI